MTVDVWKQNQIEFLCACHTCMKPDKVKQQNNVLNGTECGKVGHSLGMEIIEEIKLPFSVNKNYYFFTLL